MIFHPLVKHFIILITLNITFVVFIAICIDMLLQVFKDLKTKSTNPFQFKINNFYFTIIISLLYIVIFTGFLYFWRIYNLNKYLDLKNLCNDLLQLYQIFKQLTFVLQIDFLILVIGLISISLLLFLILQSFIFKEILKLYLYVTGASRGIVYKRKPEYILYREFVPYLRDIAYFLFGRFILYLREVNGDIIIHYLGKFAFKLYRKRYGDYIEGSEATRSFLGKLARVILLRHNQKYNILVAVSPLIIIAYDCIFNNWVLINLPKYMLVYVPIMLLKRTGRSLQRGDFILDFLYEAFYTKDNKLYCIPLKFKEIFDTLILNDLLWLRGVYTVDLEFNLYLMRHFELTDSANNEYTNEQGIRLKEESNGKFYQIETYYNENGDFIEFLDEEWVVIADKRHKI
jgi:hypothetical protein